MSITAKLIEQYFARLLKKIVDTSKQLYKNLRIIVNMTFTYDGILYCRLKTSRPICPQCYNKHKLVYLTQTTTEKNKIDQVDLSNGYSSLQNSVGLLDGKILALSCTECDYKHELRLNETLESLINRVKEL